MVTPLSLPELLPGPKQLLQPRQHHSLQGACCSADTGQAAEHYGFCLEDNPHERAQLPLETFGLPGLLDALKPAEAWLHPCGTPCWRLLHQLRLLTASPAERRQAPPSAGQSTAPLQRSLAASGAAVACQDVARP